MEIKNKSKVSFIIAAFNEEANLEKCINSCLEQTYDNIEVCVTDDGSTDRTLEILKSYNDDRIRIHSFEKNKGKVSAFNSSYEMATGDYIAVIGADDVNLPDRIQRQMNHLINNDIDLTWGGFIHIDENDEVLPDYISPLKENVTRLDILQDNFIPGNTILFKRELARKVFPIPNQLKFEDWWIAFNTVFSFKYKMLNEPVVNYRIHANNTVGNVLGDYVKLRRKNIKRHLMYHDLFDNFLKTNDFNDFVKLNHIMKCYKEACLSDSIIHRIKLLFSNLSNYKNKYAKIFLKFIFVTFFGLKGVGKVFK